MTRGRDRLGLLLRDIKERERAKRLRHLFKVIVIGAAIGFIMTVVANWSSH